MILIFKNSLFYLFFVTDILQSVFGLPSECFHQNIRLPCKLSFSCWLQGGKHAQGCGNNKWLFSCCLSENYFNDGNHSSKLRKPNLSGQTTPANKFKSKFKRRYQKKSPLRRRTDDNYGQVSIEYNILLVFIYMVLGGVGNDNNYILIVV